MGFRFRFQGSDLWFYGLGRLRQTEAKAKTDVYSVPGRSNPCRS